ncbi:MAG: discoidin domain-containing protein [Gemmataceae bacterium]|nr:discoidin domain-containing protein [Gemmataceae bacterium]
MTAFARGLLLPGCLLGTTAALAQDIPQVTTNNKNALVLEHRARLKLSASSVWGGWPVENAFDGNVQSSWFSERGDTVAHGRKPWLQVTFPADVTVKRVTVLGNRDPSWLKGYTILAGTLELLDQHGKRLAQRENDGIGAGYDFDWKLDTPMKGVRSIRFTSLGDQGKANPHDDIAIGEFQVE